MNTWRDDTSQLVQDDVDGLIDAALPFALEQLRRRGAFVPYAITIDHDGAERMHFTEPPTDEEIVLGSDAVAHYDAIFRELREEIRAAALVIDIWMDDGVDGEYTDAVRCRIEHEEGLAIEVIQPYRLRRFKRPPLLGEGFGEEGERLIWG